MIMHVVQKSTRHAVRQSPAFVMIPSHAAVVQTPTAWRTDDANSGRAIYLPSAIVPHTSSLTIFYKPTLISRNPTILRQTTFGHVSKHLNVY